MAKIAVVYWSGTGNTEAMAECVAAGVNAAGQEACQYTADQFQPELLDDFAAVAFGCPSMGVEVLEEEVFEPMFTACLPKLAGKKLALFGSYGWGDGEWMRNWEETCKGAGAELACDSVICMDAPDAEAQAACEALGKALAG